MHGAPHRDVAVHVVSAVLAARVELPREAGVISWLGYHHVRKGLAERARLIERVERRDASPL